MGIEITGDKEVIALLERIEKHILPSIIEDIALEAGRLIAQSAREKAPVDTGALRDSITTDVQVRGPTSVSVEVGPSVDYADDVEFGSLRQQAQPYLRPAIDETEDAAVEAAAEVLRRALENL